MENYMFKPNEIKEKCYELNRSIAEKGLELNIVPGQHISEQYVAGYHICVHKNLEERPISRDLRCAVFCQARRSTGPAEQCGGQPLWYDMAAKYEFKD